MKQKFVTVFLLIAFVAICMAIPALLPAWFYRGVVLLLLFAILALQGSIVNKKS
jgi:hypothetical protein